MYLAMVLSRYKLYEEAHFEFSVQTVVLLLYFCVLYFTFDGLGLSMKGFYLFCLATLGKS